MHRVLAVADLEVIEQLDGVLMRCRGAKSRKVEHHGHVVGGIEEQRGRQVLKGDTPSPAIRPQSLRSWRRVKAARPESPYGMRH
ncbi:hypothetical protein GCM10010869_03280 [Mesorhizobium tianshanense]|nr:hypothetical protein GCM10010869_03280 [Mesorhizobium tianshanense]